MDLVAQAASFGRATTAYQAFEEVKQKYADARASTEAGAVERVHETGAQKALAIAQQLGGVYTKAAQFVASIHGGAGDSGIPKQYTDTLAKMTDQAASRPFSEVESVILEELNINSLTDYFSYVNKQPLAAASLAQVHRARLHDGSDVALKVQHKGIKEQAEADLSVLESMASRMQPAGLDLTWIARDFKENIREEVDFQSEANNAQLLADEFNSKTPGCAHNDVVHVPWVYHSTQRLLILEFIEPLLHVSDTDALRKRRLPVRDICDAISHAFFRMTLVRSTAHGDPHHGNLYVRPLDSKHSSRHWQLILLDHGLFYHIDNTTRTRLCSLVLACVKQQRSVVEHWSRYLAGDVLWKYLPPLLSPYFVTTSKLTLADVKAAMQQRLPPDMQLYDIGKLLETLHGSGGRNGLLGVLHCFGYIRTLLQASKAFSERRRLRALSRAAWQGLYGEPPSRWRTAVLAMQVETLHFRIALLSAVYAPAVYLPQQLSLRRRSKQKAAAFAAAGIVAGTLSYMRLVQSNMLFT